MTAERTGSHVDVERMPGSRVLRVYGSMAVDAQPDVEEVSIDDPALYAAMALKQMLVDGGITVQGPAVVKHQTPVDGHGFLATVDAPLTSCEENIVHGGVCAVDCLIPTPAQGEVLASHASAPLADDVRLTLKVSQNLHAELLLRRVGRAARCAPDSDAKGAQMRRAFLLHAGLDPGDFVFYDGSGLSGHDLVTPRATAQLMAYAAKQPWFAAWKAALPVGGEDGSLASRFPDPPLKDHVFAKTGTLGESRGLSGYLDAASGRQVIFSIYVDDHSPVGGADRAVMDKIVAAIARNQ
jgi:D-alanyl-D-alanine carboxypeptidase/D-alanyl-D-alanine-endopeptidase (penicillin-binding protein 4)